MTTSGACPRPNRARRDYAAAQDDAVWAAGSRRSLSPKRANAASLGAVTERGCVAETSRSSLDITGRAGKIQHDSTFGPAAAGLRHSRAPLQSQNAGLVTKPRTTPRPCLRIENQARLCRVVLNVFASLQFMVTVTHKRVPVIRPPKLTTPSQEPVRLLRRVLLPTLQNFRHRCGIHFEQCVNVIRHHDPCAQ